MKRPDYQFSIAKDHPPKRIRFVTFGCKVNQYETQAIREMLAKEGYEESTAHDAADVYIINTCTVTSIADRKCRHAIRRAIRENSDATIIITGCYAHRRPDEVRAIEGVDYVIHKSEAAKIPQLLRNGIVQAKFPSSSHSLMTNPPSFNLEISKFQSHNRAFLKIQDGCNSNCSYCIVPKVRGPIRSRPLDEVIAEAHRLTENGYKEIVLTGIHVGRYGHDFVSNDKADLAKVIESLLPIRGVERLRLSSIEVNEITSDLVDLAASSSKLCPHFHIPLQSGDDGILLRMNRKYGASEYLETLERIRSRIDNPSFTTDVIVGFPGEQEDHFQSTIEVCRKASFSRVHIFPFSPREETPAFSMPEQCHQAETKERAKILRNVADELALNYKRQFIGDIVDVLIETRRDEKTGKLCGYTERYVKAMLDGSDSLMNTLQPVLVETANPGFVSGVRQNHFGTG